MKALSTLGWIFAALNLICAAIAMFSRDSGDAATRGLGKGLGAMLGVLTLFAIALLLFGRRGGDLWRTMLVIAGALVAAAPALAVVTLTVSRQGLGLIYPSLRQTARPERPSPKYEYPDAATREAALALVRNDYARLEALLRANPAPDLAARDELGGTLLGIAMRVAIMDVGSEQDLAGLRLLLAAGAKPAGDADGNHDPDESALEAMVSARSKHASAALELLLAAGLRADTPMRDGRSLLFHPRLKPEAAQALLRHGINREAHDQRGGAEDWSAVTYQADLHQWATALALLEAGVPRDHGSPPGSVLARVLKNGERWLTEDDRADRAYQELVRRSAIR